MIVQADPAAKSIRLTPQRVSPILPTTIAEIEVVARKCLASGLGHYGPNDDLETKLAKAITAIMQGLENGLPPIAAMQSIKVDNGRCLIFGDAVPALLWAAGFDIEQTIEGDGEGLFAKCVITRPGGKKIIRTFSIADAKHLRLWDTRPVVDGQPNASYWYLYGERMLGYRALGFAVKDGASDVTRGLYIREEYDAQINKPLPIMGQPKASSGALAAATVQGGETAVAAKPGANFEIPDDDTPPVVAQDHAAGPEPLPQTGPAASPDIPDEMSADAVIRDIEREIARKVDPYLLEVKWRSELKAMSDEDREIAFAVMYPEKDQASG